MKPFNLEEIVKLLYEEASVKTGSREVFAKLLQHQGLPQKSSLGIALAWGQGILGEEELGYYAITDKLSFAQIFAIAGLMDRLPIKELFD